jgi:hypothetical protein
VVLEVQGGREMTVKEAIEIVEKRKIILENAYQYRDAEALEMLIEIAKKSVSTGNRDGQINKSDTEKEAYERFEELFESLSRKDANQ